MFGAAADDFRLASGTIAVFTRPLSVFECERIEEVLERKHSSLPPLRSLLEQDERDSFPSQGEQDLREAFNDWLKLLPDFSVRYNPAKVSDCSSFVFVQMMDEAELITMELTRGGVWAFTRAYSEPRFHRWTGKPKRGICRAAVIRFNADCFVRKDLLKNVAAHEFGHVLGLNHIGDSPRPDTEYKWRYLMQPATPRNAPYRGPTYRDVYEGIAKSKRYKLSKAWKFLPESYPLN